MLFYSSCSDININVHNIYNIKKQFRLRYFYAVVSHEYKSSAYLTYVKPLAPKLLHCSRKFLSVYVADCSVLISGSVTLNGAVG